MIDTTEKNFKVRQTGAGAAAIGLAHSESLKVGRCVPGDEVFAMGKPHVGTEVLKGEERHTIAGTRDVRRLAGSGFIHEVIPVGSKGIYFEANVLARDSNLQFNLDKHVQIDLAKSAGPATVLLFASRGLHRVVTQIPKPVNRIGRLKLPR
jgi:hypothetical protein